MTFPLKPVAAAVLLAAAQLGAGLAFAAPPAAPASASAASAPAAVRPPVALQTPSDWVSYEDTTFTPVADEVSRRLHAASVAFDAKDKAKAAAELRAVADALTGQSEEAAKHPGKGTAAAELRLKAAVTRLQRAASDLEQGKVETRAQFDKVFDRALLADLDSRWIETDVTTWYPVSEEPQRHFAAAVAAYGKKDYAAAAAEIRKANGYLRLEAGRADGKARGALDRSVHELDKLADSAAKGTVKGESVMHADFARADNALALAHHAKAVESWTARQYDKTGYELKAAAHGLESAADWVGGEAKQGASAAVAGTRSVGDKLASGATWTRAEVGKGIADLGHGIDKLGREIGRTTRSKSTTDSPSGT